MRPALAALPTVALTALLGMPTAVCAQTIPSAYRYVEGRQEVGFFTGYRTVGTGRFGYAPSGGTLLGARYGIEISGPLSLEGVAGTMIGKRDVVSPGRPEGDRVVGEADVYLTTIDGRLKLTATGDRSWHGFSPFLVLGGGIAFDLAGAPAADALLDAASVFEFGTSFFGTLGVGTRWFASDHFALRTDGIFSLWKVETPPGFADPIFGLENVAEGEWLQGLSVTVSLLFRW